MNPACPPRARAAALLALCLGVADANAVRAAEGPHVSSGTDDLTFTRLERLPRATAASKRVPSFCERYVVQPKTAGGRSVRAAGWSITAEARLGSWTVVSFAGALSPATSGTCVVSDGNLGVFDAKGALVALAYAPRGAKRSIGKVSELEGGAVRVWDGDPPGMPLADLQATAGGAALRLGTLAAQETLCGGRAIVPNIYDQPINEARKVLWARGWAPVPTQPAPDPTSREGELAKRGVTEAEGCSGTGFGYCSFNYRGSGGVLNVVTIGEADFPTVSGYAVKCP